MEFDKYHTFTFEMEKHAGKHGNFSMRKFPRKGMN